MKGHIDCSFENVVIVIVARNRARRPGAKPKIISFGVQNGQSQNRRAELPNPEYSCYIFWSWMVDFGVHGVPFTGGTDACIVIIRKGRGLTC